VQVKVAILDPDARLLPEMSSSVSFLNSARTDQELQEKPRIWLSPSAVVNGRVAVVDATNHVQWKSVGTGATREGRIEITSGLAEGERIVGDKSEALQQGELVRLGDA